MDMLIPVPLKTDIFFVSQGIAFRLLSNEQSQTNIDYCVQVLDH